MSQNTEINQHPAGPHTSSLLAKPLCAVHGSPGSLAAVQEATELVGRGGHITLLEVTSGPDRFQSPAILPHDATQNLENAVEIAKAGGVATRAEVDPECPPPRIIVDWAADYSLLAMGAPQTSWLAGAITASATDAAISHLPTALLITRRSEKQASQRRIVVATDGSDGSDQLIELAAELAEPQAADVVLVHASNHRTRSCDERVEAQAGALRQTIGDRARVDQRSGKAQEAVIDVATELGASLIVMGSRGLHGLRAIGSVSRHVMHDAPCSVLLVPPTYLGA